LAVSIDTANGLNSVQEIQSTTLRTGQWQPMGDISVRCSLLGNLFHSLPVDLPEMLYSSWKQWVSYGWMGAESGILPISTSCQEV